MIQSKISHSSSFEDVILQRALQDVVQGCYVDVGGSSPLFDNNTAAFYEKGWRGICLEPLPYLKPEWERYRPEDILITAAAGAAPGQTSFFIFETATQISTASNKILKHWKDHHRSDDKEVSVPVVTLNDVLKNNLNNRSIHLMSIDVEGFEKEVLQGLDLQVYRPWIFVIEATLPGTRIPNHHEWEPMLLAAEYTMVLNDGVNRFYLANEKSELKEHFTFPPNIWDNFLTFKHVLQLEKVKDLEEKVELMEAELAVLKQHIKNSDCLPDNFAQVLPELREKELIEKVKKLEETNKSLINKIQNMSRMPHLKSVLDK